MKRILTFLITAFLPLTAMAANEVSLTSNVTLVLPSDSSEYTLLNGSTFDSLIVNNTNFTFGMSAGSSVEITSADKKKLTNSLLATIQCESTQSRIFMSKPSGATTEDITVTPSGTCSSTGGSGGGGASSGGSSGSSGGGSSSGGSSAPAPLPATETVDKVAQLKAQIASVQAAIAQKLAQKGVQTKYVAPAFGVFARSLAPGQRDDEIKRLQELLATDKSIYPEGKVTGYYGPATLNAVKRFQKKYGISQVGKVGPQTISKLNEVFGGTIPVVVPETKPATQASVISSPASAAVSTQVQQIQEQIKAIQAKLIQEQIKQIQEKIKSLQK
ncbi:MAG: peptidoglycan-binding domain-containing protein [bacterium]|nr:peptidoglycan-binding domain-containing protein [bacterium]